MVNLPELETLSLAYTGLGLKEAECLSSIVLALPKLDMIDLTGHQMTSEEHFKFSEDVTEIIGKTNCGRATVSALQLNSDLQTTARAFWKLTGIFPPKN